MYSLKKDFKFEKDWKMIPTNDKFVYECYREAVDIGMFKDCEKSFKYCYGITSSVAHMFPLLNDEQLLVAGAFMQCVFYFDDFLEGDSLSEKDTKEMVLKITNICIDCKLSAVGPHSKMEIFFLNFINKLQVFRTKYNVEIHRYNQFIKHLNDYLVSCDPFNKCSTTYSYPHYESYNFFKSRNSGSYVCLSLNILLIPNVPFDTRVWLNPKFDRFVYYGGCQLAALNDCASYAKEMKDNSFKTNPLYFIQKTKNYSFDQAYKFILNFNNELIEQMLKDEKELLESIKSPQERSDLKFFTTCLKLILGGNLSFSLECCRYADSSSPFIEQINPTNNTSPSTYESIIDQFYNTTTNSNNNINVGNRDE